MEQLFLLSLTYTDSSNMQICYKSIDYDDVKIDKIWDFRKLPAVESWGECGYFHFVSKILPHTPKKRKVQLPLG